MNAYVILGSAVAGTAFFLLKSRREYLKLPELPAVVGTDPGDEVTIIIPARNEEKRIARVVESFQGWPVLVVDDGSEDRTAELAKSAGAYVIPAPPLPPGAAGKPSACWAGARVAVSQWILFVDADTWFKSNFLPSLLAQARKESLDLLTVFLKQECVTLSEKIILPYAFALYFCGVSARRTNSPEARDSLANGQCMLFRREAYHFLGGHAAVADSIVEDVKLASLAKRHRMRTKVMRAEHLGSVRMYEGFGEIWNGFRKNSFRFLLINPRGGVQVIAASILLTSYLPVLALLLWRGLWAPAALYAFVPAVLLAPWYRTLLWSLLSPIAIYVFQAIALIAMFTPLHRRRAVWKGRRV